MHCCIRLLCSPWYVGNWYSNNFWAAFICTSVNSLSDNNRTWLDIFKVELKIFNLYPFTINWYLCILPTVITFNRLFDMQSLACLAYCVRLKPTTLLVVSRSLGWSLRVVFKFSIFFGSVQFL